MSTLDNLLLKNRDETDYEFELRRRLSIYLYEKNFLKNLKNKEPYIIMYSNMIINHLYKNVIYPKKYQNVIDEIIRQI